MAHKKGMGSTRNGRDSEAKRLGVKKFGEVVFNAYRIETEGGEPDKNLLALSPTLCGTFHMPQFFIDIDK